MDKEEFAKRLIELVNEYTQLNINNLGLQYITINVTKDKMPEIQLKGILGVINK